MKAALFAAIALVLAAGQPSPTRSSPSSLWVLDHATLAANSTPTGTGLRLLRGIAYRPDLTIEEGTIEFELAPPAGPFAGVAFRMASTADYEIVYFTRSDDGERWKAIQYQPVFAGETTWQLYHDEGYQAAIPKEAGRALRVRLAFAGDRASVFLNDDPIAILRIPELKRAPAAGAVGFWSVGEDGAAGNEIRNLRVDSSRVPSFGERMRIVPSDRQLMRWRISERFAAPDGVHPPATLPAGLAPDTWPALTAEATGLVNLTKAIGNPAGRQETNVFGGAGWGLAYAAVTIESQAERTVRLLVAYSDGIGVYLNGRRLYAGDNSADSRYPDYLGIVGNETETVDLPLRAGPNALVLAVTDKAFGWGFRAKLDSVDGLTIAPSQKFEFRAGAWVSLHHFLYVLGRARNDAPDSHRDAVVKAPADVDGLSTRTAEERAAWDDAVSVYASGLSKKDAVFDRDLVKVTAALASAETRPDLSGLGLDPPLVAALERVMPVYRAVWWPRHSNANAARQRELQAQLDAHGDAAVKRLTALYGMTWPDRPRIIDLVAYANWAGAYSTDGGLIVVSSLDDSQRGPLGLEILLHESSHQWDDAIQARIARVAAASATKPPRDLSHMLIFYTTGEVVRELVPGHVPYAVKHGLWERGSLRGMKAVLDAWWQPYLRGSGTFDDALAAVLAHL